MPRTQRKAFVDDDGAKIRVEHRGAEGILETSDDDRLIDERIGRAAQLAPFVRNTLPAAGGMAGDNKRFEIGAARLGPAQRGRHQLRRAVVAVLAGVTGMAFQ